MAVVVTGCDCPVAVCVPRELGIAFEEVSEAGCEFEDPVIWVRL